MGLFGKSKEEKIAEFKEKQSTLNGKELKKLLKLFKDCLLYTSDAADDS